MASRTPVANGLATAPSELSELASHRYWGRYASAADLPNAASNAAVAPSFPRLRAGDVAYVTGDSTLYQCTSPGTAGGADAIWVSLGSASPSSSVWTVPAGVAVGDAVYVTGSFTADQADNTSIATVPSIGVVIAKPLATTATLAYFGEASVFAGLTPGAIYYVGTLGAITTSPPVTAGNVVQRVGVAADANTLIVNPGLVDVVL